MSFDLGLFLWTAFQLAILLYFLALNGTYILLNLVSMHEVHRAMQRRGAEGQAIVPTGFEPPISIVVPAYNEAATIVASVRAMLQLHYPDYEVIVVNDGSKDATLDTLIREFGLQKFPAAYRDRLRTRPVRAVYRSTRHPDLQVIDKENGGKADANNAGINVARHPLVLNTDADSLLDRESLLRSVQPFLEDPSTVACGGTIRAANGCSAGDGVLTSVSLPRSWLARIQIVEYLRAFLFGRIGWSRVGGLLIVSGAFALFHKETVVEVGGYRHDTLGEDIDLTMRLHLRLRAKGVPYRIHQIPDPICWTEVPESRDVLARQRTRWHRGLSEALWANRALLFNPRGGVPGWIGFPFFVLFEWGSPVVEALGWVVLVGGFFVGVVEVHMALLFLALALGLGALLSTSALLLEEMSFHTYPRARHVALLLVAAVLENFGYRQLHAVWRLTGIARWMTGKKAAWGSMQRVATWTRTPDPARAE